MEQNPINSNRHKLKIVFIGDSGVGKSSIVNRYARQQFDFQTHSTVGVQFATRQARAYINNVPSFLTIQLWDTAGQERFRAIMASYFKNALGLVLVYDITKHHSFENLNKWYALAMENCNEFVSILVIGNKTDLANLRKVTQKEAGDWAAERNALFYEVSSLSNEGIDAALEFLLIRTTGTDVEIVHKLNTVDKDNDAGISRYSQTSRLSHISKDQPYREKELRSCC